MTQDSYECFITARSYVNAAAILHINAPSMIPAHNAPFYQLLYHAFELTLKARLLMEGCDAKELMNFDVRHSLKKLVNLCEEKNIALLSSFKELAKEADETHRSHSMRYFKFGHWYTTLNPEKALMSLSTQHQQIQKYFINEEKMEEHYRYVETRILDSLKMESENA